MQDRHRDRDAPSPHQSRGRTVTRQIRQAPLGGLRGADDVLGLQRCAGNAAVGMLRSPGAASSRSVLALLPSLSPVVQRQADDAPSQTSVPDSKATLRQLIRRVEQIYADAGSGPDSERYLPTVASTLEQMRAVAADGDETAAAMLVSAFTGDRLRVAAAQLTLASEPDASVGVDGAQDRSDAPGVSRQPLPDIASRLLAVGDIPVMRHRAGSEFIVQRDAAAALIAAGSFLLTADAEAAPVEAAAGPPGWAVAGTVAIVAVGLIGIGYLMAGAQPETLTAEEEEAIRRKEAGEPYDRATYDRARRKQIKNEKYEGERNKRKQRGGG
ncbi:hypothetical protein FraQA3DRAFT_1393 [Frankia sp. QA3]|nr:hypothetical protein FraQA3DRAFT_1393 [Frankia sp. QA3]